MQEQALDLIGRQIARGFIRHAESLHQADGGKFQPAIPDKLEKESIQHSESIVDSGGIEPTGVLGCGKVGYELRGDGIDESRRPASAGIICQEIGEDLAVSGPGVFFHSIDADLGFGKELRERNAVIGEAGACAVEFQLDIGQGKLGDLFRFADRFTHTPAVDSIIEIPDAIS